MRKRYVKQILCICIFLIFCFVFPRKSYPTTVIGVVVPEGIVLAGDSRITVTISKTIKDLGKEKSEPEQKDKITKRVKVISRIGTDYAQKVFQLNEKVGAVTHGEARILKKNIHSLVEEFKASDSSIKKYSIDEVAKKLKSYFDDLYKKQLAKYPNTKIGKINFMVGGYDGSGKGKLLSFFVPKGEIKELRSTDTNFGASWGGQISTISRLIKGCSPELEKIIQKHNVNHELNLEQKIDPHEFEYALGFEYMTMKDAIDFASFLMNATIEAQRFSYGTKKNIGVFPGVGGPIDIAIITPTGLKWIQKKRIEMP